MSDSRKKRLSMLDSLAAAGHNAAAPSPAPTGSGNAASMMTTNRALRSARDAVDGHHVWELDPAQITDLRPHDRMDADDVQDLLQAIETNGQTVPILVRRDPADENRYLLVYGRRRLEAIRQSDKVEKIRCLVANLDDESAVRAQISENMARRDLSFIEKALFARELVDNGFGSQSQVAEVLTVTKSAVSMALTIVDLVGADLVRAIGPAHGVGRPRWEALGKAIEQVHDNPDKLVEIALKAREQVAVDRLNGAVPDDLDSSIAALEAVEAALPAPVASSGRKPAGKAARTSKSRPLRLDGTQGGTVKRTEKAITITLDNGPFAQWVETEAQDLFQELHARWKERGEA